MAGIELTEIQRRILATAASDPEHHAMVYLSGLLGPDRLDVAVSSTKIGRGQEAADAIAGLEAAGLIRVVQGSRAGKRYGLTPTGLEVGMRLASSPGGSIIDDPDPGRS